MSLLESIARVPWNKLPMIFTGFLLSTFSYVKASAWGLQNGLGTFYLFSHGFFLFTPYFVNLPLTLLLLLEILNLNALFSRFLLDPKRDSYSSTKLEWNWEQKSSYGFLLPQSLNMLL
ncbi:MAG TPA: hypothetical protein VJN71_06360 [Nitrososphaerales archaeon]|nr:hypothetical protein [Nitrososphaerales archaeon]